MRSQRYKYLCAFLLLWVPTVATQAQSPDYNFRGIPATIEELDLAFPLKGKYTGQLDIQTVTQGAYLGVNNNPFAYWQRLHFRPWLQYHPNKTVLLATSLSYMKRYAIPPTGAKRGDEVRFTVMANFTQPKRWGSLYEQVRGEIKNNRKDGTPGWTHVPRVRLRFGQNFNVKEERQQKIVSYAEIMFKHQAHTKGFDIGRVFGGYSLAFNPKLALTAGFILQWQLKSNGTDVDVYFGPSVAMRWTFGNHKHPAPPPDPDID